MSPTGWLIFAVVALVAFVILEGKRQERKYGRSGRGSFARTGLLELQRHLEPDRKVEIVLKERDSTEAAESGDKPEAGQP